jgi:hypothetical protein
VSAYATVRLAAARVYIAPTGINVAPARINIATTMIHDIKATRFAELAKLVIAYSLFNIGVCHTITSYDSRSYAFH